MVVKETRERVLVFCASSQSSAQHYRDVAQRLGVALARAGRTVVYGGGGVGSMGALADGALESGGSVVGIQPKFMADLEWYHDGISELHLVADMHERKRMMIEISDAVVALPGGSGTLEEIFEVITEKRLGRYHGPIVFVNQGGYFDSCIAQLELCVTESFMDERHLEMWSVVAEPEEVIDAIDVAPDWTKDAIEFAVP